MIKKIFFLFVSLFSINAQAIHAEDFSDPSLYFTRVDTTIHREKYSILSPLEQGAIKVLFIGRYDRVASISVGILARLDCHIETVLTRSRSIITSENSLKSKKITDFQNVTAESPVERLERLLGYNWDVIWLDFDIQSLPEHIRDSIFENCSVGGGLVYVGQKKDIESFGTRGKINEESLEFISYDTLNKPTAIPCDLGIIVVMPPISSDTSPLGVSNYYNTAANSIFFSSGVQTGTMITEIQIPRKQIEQEVMGIMKFRVHLINEDKPDTMAVNFWFRNENGEIVHESTDKFIIQNGRSFVILDFVQCPIGSYSLDVSVSDSKGIKSFAGSSFQVSVSDKIADVALWNKSVKEGEFIIGTVKTTTPIKDGITINIELTESNGKPVEKSNVDLVPGRLSADFTFKIKHSFSRLMFIKVYYYKNNELVQSIRTPLFIKRPYDPSTFSFIVNNNSDSDLLISEKYEILAREGVNAFAFDISDIQSPGKAFNKACAASLYGADILPLFSNTIQFPEIPQNDVWENHLKSIVDTLKQTNPIAYSIESNALSGTSDKLESMSVTLEEARRENSYTEWLTIQRDRLHGFEQVYLHTADIISKSDSTSLIGISGFDQPIDTVNGYSIYNFSEAWDMIMTRFTADTVYRDSGLSRLVNVYAKDRALKGFIIDDSQFNSNTEYFHYIPWYSLYNGMNCIWWDNMYSGDCAALTPQISISPPFSIVAEETREIMTGIDKLILKSKRHEDGIAIYYSPESVFAAYTSRDNSMKEYGESKALASLKSFYRICRELDFTPTYITDSQLENNLLEHNKYQVLILPYSQAMSDKTIQIIREFVRLGGTLIADMRPSVMDENLMMRTSGGLDDIFGIIQSTERTSTEMSGTFGLINSDGISITVSDMPVVCRVDPTLKVQGSAEIIARIDEHPAVIINKFGEGRGIFLNMGINNYFGLRFRDEGKVFSDVLLMCLRKAGVKEPFVALTDDTDEKVAGAVFSLFDDGDIEYIGLLAEPAGEDTVMTGMGPLNMILRANKIPKYVYDIRNKDFLGAKDIIPLHLKPGRAELFALLPYRVQQLNLNLKTTVVHSGEYLEFETGIIPHDTAVIPGRHVLQIQIIRADNRDISYYKHSVETGNGKYSGNVPVGFDEKPGQWILEVTDIISGKKAEKGFII
ncbi:beta-galactosidase trimerization domain-containing protein, partial [Candidatus Latescibacterota bacterium]